MPDGTPNYLSIDANGNVTATFTGSVILLESGSSAPSGAHQVAWQDSGGVVREFIQGYTPSIGSHSMELETVVGAGLALLTINASDPDGSGQNNSIGAQLQSSGGGSALITIMDAAGVNGASAFLIAPNKMSGSLGGPTQPTRTFGTAIQPNANRPTLVTVACYLQINAAAQQAEVLVRVASSSGGLATGKLAGFMYITNSNGQEAKVIDTCFMVPAGWWYEIFNTLDPVTANIIEFVLEQAL